MIYLVNFPKLKAVIGQGFIGDKKTKDSLLKRGIIGEGKATVDINLEDALSIIKDKDAQIEALKKELDSLEPKKETPVKKKQVKE